MENKLKISDIVGNQLAITKWIREEIGIDKNAPDGACIYFDDADLILGDNVIIRELLINQHMTCEEVLIIVRNAMRNEYFTSLRP
jgi:hypothetical protein